MSKLMLGCALSVAVGAALGWGLHGEKEVSCVMRSSTVAEQSQGPMPSGAPSGIDLEQLHAAIREELAAASAGQTSGRQSGAEPRAPAPASAELVAERRAALQEIHGMVSSGQWGDAERTSFHRKLAVLDAEQAKQALEEVIAGLNNGSIRATTNSPL